jgi:trehalose synthase
MLKTVKLSSRSLHDYRELVSPKLLDEIETLGRRLAGRRVLEINATDQGGGVAEILRSELPLLVDLGLDAQWRVIEAPAKFFEVTKRIHNGLQGDFRNLTAAQWQLYEEHNRQFARDIGAGEWDCIIVHDPQPAAMRFFTDDLKRGDAKWVWRCHLDSRHANPHYRQRLQDFLKPYEAAIYTLKKYVLPGYEPKHLGIIPMAIDPLADKGMDMSIEEAKSRVSGFGINANKPLVAQISRFDPWKDPIGVIEAWKLAKKEVPNLQLALVGDYASDDPEGRVIFEQVVRIGRGVRDLYLIANKADDKDVRAFQMAANVVVQKSLREGFGLTVTEALWAGTPVVGSNVGGIPVQIEDGKSGYLVESIEETAEKVVELVRDARLAEKMGRYGREFVRQNFLLPRLLRDDLRFITKVLELT